MAVPDDIRMQGFGIGSGVFQQVDPTYNAARISSRPLDVGVGGHYSINAQTGTMAAGIASAAQVFQVRYAGSGIMVLKQLTVQCATLTGFAATALGAPLQLFLGHGSTANGSGGTALAPTSSSNKARSSFASTAFATTGEIRIATTGALTAATGQALEAAAIGGCMGAPNITLVQSAVMTLSAIADGEDHPVLLNSGDTLAVCTLNPAATGTWVATFTMDWAEVASF